jgi:hypothetical protein
VLFNGVLGTPSSGTIGAGMTLGGVAMALGSDATGDIYYRNSSGILTRLPIGPSGSLLESAGGLPGWASSGTESCYNYLPVSGDNTSNLNSSLTAAIAAGQTLCLPAGIIGIAGTWDWPSNTRVRGAGKFLTIIQRIANTPFSGTCCQTGMLISFKGSSGTHVSNIYASDFTVDANAQNQTTSQYWTVAMDYADNVTIERTSWIHAFNGGNIFGNGLNGTPSAPNGTQTSTNFTFRDNLVDCSGGNVSPNYGDCLDILWVNGVHFENNIVQNSGTTCFGGEFNSNFNYTNNHFINCEWGIYGETEFDGIIDGNEIYATGNIVSSHPTLGIIGIWTADGNQTYVGGGFVGSARLKIINNSIHDLTATSGNATSVAGIIINAPGSTLAAQDIIVNNNTTYNLSVPSVTIIGYGLGGGMDTISVTNNKCRSFGGSTNICVLATGTYTSGGEAPAQSSANMVFDNNTAPAGITPQSPAPTCVASSGAGSSPSCLVDLSTDSSGTLTITAGSGASSSGNVAISFATSLGSNGMACTCSLGNQSAAWNALNACTIANAASTGPTLTWSNNGSSLASGSTYAMNWMCKGR